MTKEEARAVIKQTGIKIEPGVVYDIFACGHASEHKKGDKPVKMYNPVIQQDVSVCPQCQNLNAFFITKYRKNEKGGEVIGKQLHSGNMRRDGRPEVDKKYLNKSKADPGRWDCVHRAKCRDEYQDYEAIPCKGCKKYKEAGFYERIS